MVRVSPRPFESSHQATGRLLGFALPSSTTLMLGIIAGMWLASQIQRFTLAAYVGASSMMIDLGITAASAGFLASIYFPVYGAMQIPSGILADQANQRRTLLISGFTLVAAGLAFAAAPGFLAATIARAAIGISAGLLWLSGLKLCATLPGRAYGRRLSFMMAIGAVGSVIGLAGLPALLTAMNWRPVAALVTVPTLALTVVLFFVQVPGLASQPPLRILWRRCLGALGHVPAVVSRLDFWRMALPSMFWTGTQFAVLTWLPRYAHDVLALPSAAIGILPAVLPLGQVIGNVVIGQLATRRPRLGLPIFFGFCAAYAASLGLFSSGLAARAGLVPLYGIVFLLGLLNGAFFISLAWIAGAVPSTLFGTASGVLNGLGFVPAFVLPWLMGGLMDSFDHPSSPAWVYSAGAYSVAFGVSFAALTSGLLASFLLAGIARIRDNRHNTHATSPAP